ncbi:hypothetical protein D3C85_1880350 [compost metagenome]
MNKKRDQHEQRFGIHVGEAGFILHIDMRDIIFDQIEQQHTGNQTQGQSNNSRLLDRLRH